mmetsp:Transcript_8937/g.21208  ORF Transcript_8937/g.21208 Transcript_8937/m.21208 type:complete len:207 (+) Transcript_8937:70-690(+)
MSYYSFGHLPCCRNAWEVSDIFLAFPGLGHHKGHSRPPFKIVLRVLVLGRIGSRPVHFNQQEIGWVVHALEHIEPQIAILLHRLHGIGTSGLLERLLGSRLHLDHDVCDVDVGCTLRPLKHQRCRMVICRLSRKNGVILHCGPWHSHHICHVIAPLLIVQRFLVSGGPICIPVDFDQGKVAGRISLLKHVEPLIQRLALGLPCILQ